MEVLRYTFYSLVEVILDFVSLFKFLECIVHSFWAYVGARFQTFNIPSFGNGSLDGLLVLLYHRTSLQERFLEHHERLGKEKIKRKKNLGRSSVHSLVAQGVTKDYTVADSLCLVQIGVTVPSPPHLSSSGGKWGVDFGGGKIDELIAHFRMCDGHP